MGTPSDDDSSGVYAFEPERFLIPPMEGFLKRIFAARWGLILISAPGNINLPTIMNFLANFSLQQSYYSEFSATTGGFDDLDKEHRKIRSIEEVIDEARSALDSEDADYQDRIPRNSDMVFIPELSRDLAPKAVEGALTGNLVAAGIRAEGTFPALKELITILESYYLVASCLIGIIGLNSVDRICPYCKIRVEHEIDPGDLILIGRKEQTLHSFKGTGCRQCDFTGHQGRILIHEGFEASEKVRSRILDNLPLRHLRMIAKQEGMTTLLDAAWHLAEQGETSLDEVIRIAEVTDPGKDNSTGL